MQLSPFRRAGPWLLWTVILLLVTFAMIALRGDTDQAHVALLYLLVVLGGSVAGGRSLGFFLAGACFFLIDYFLQQPYDPLSVDKPLDWVILVALPGT